MLWAIAHLHTEYIHHLELFDMNMVILSGTIGSEPEFKQYDAGKRRGSFSVALDQYGKGGGKIETFWLACYAWDAVCDRLQRCQKIAKLSGRKINLTGVLTQSNWIDTDSGEKKNRIFVNVQMFDLLPSFRNPTVSEQETTLSDAEIIFDGRPAFSQRSRYSRQQKARK